MTKKKKKYEAPKIRKIELAVEEAVLAGCKTQGTQVGRVNKWCLHSQCKRDLGS